MNPFQTMALNWQMVGLVMALVLLFAIGVAALTRLLTKHAPDGQTFGLVVLGVAGVLAIAGLVVGYEVVGFLLICFAVSAIPMAVEYYSRTIAQERAARETQEKMVADEHPGPDR